MNFRIRVAVYLLSMQALACGSSHGEPAVDAGETDSGPVEVDGGLDCRAIDCQPPPDGCIANPESTNCCGTPFICEDAGTPDGGLDCTDIICGLPRNPDCYVVQTTTNCCEFVCESRCGGKAGEVCDDDEYCAYEDLNDCGYADGQGVCMSRPTACPDNDDLVCGCDGQTYSNGCGANAAGTSVYHEGPCETPVNLVCGGKGGVVCPEGMFCDYAALDGCAVPDGQGYCDQIPTNCPEIYSPVCGCDGTTYSNDCDARSNGVGVQHTGECSGDR